MSGIRGIWEANLGKFLDVLLNSADRMHSNVKQCQHMTQRPQQSTKCQISCKDTRRDGNDVAMAKHVGRDSKAYDGDFSGIQ